MIIPNFLGGVSQQPDDLRLPNQVREAVNLNLSPVGGAAKRWPTEHIEEIVNSELEGYMLHPIERDGVTYLVAIGDEDVRVFTSAGVEVEVHDTTAAGPTYTPDFSYLANSSRETLRAQNIVDTAFVLNTLIPVAGGTGAALASWVDDGEAGGFIKQVNYGVKYTVKIETDAPLTTEVSYTVPSVTELAALAVGTFTAVATAGQAAGTDPFILTFDANMADELIIEVNTVSSATSGWRYEPGTRSLYRTTATLAAGNTVDVGRVARTLNFVLRTDVVAKKLITLLDALTGISVEYEDGESSFRVYAANDVIEKFEIIDSVAGTYSSGWTDTVRNIVDLPTVFKHGAIIRVGGNESETADDYYVRFESDEWSKAGRDYSAFDSFSGFGKGRWAEFALPVSGEGAFDETTMPHVLVRSVDDGGGTYTGTPNAIFFDWRTFNDWDIRESGDSESNPVPSFIGFPINDLFFWQGRLGFLADAYVVMSEAGNVSNFWRTTVQALPDSDVIDIASTEDEGSVLLNAVPLDTRLYLFSKQSQIAVIGNPVISPSSVEAPVVSKFLASENIQPTLVGRSLFFAFAGAQFQGIREFIPGENALQFGDLEITAAVPKYITKGEGRLLGSTVNNSLIFHTTAEPRTLWVYQYYRAGSDLLQSAWSRWDFEGEIVDFCIVDEVVYLMVLHGTYTSLEKISLGEGRVDVGSDIVIRLDRRISDGDVSISAYDIPNDETVFVLPYELDTTQEPEVVVKEDGRNLIVSDITYATSTVTVRGNHTTTPLFIGIPYIAEVLLNRPVLAQPTREGQAPVRSGETTINFLHLIVDNTGFIQVDVSYRGGNDFTYPFAGTGVTTHDAGLEDSSFDDMTPVKDSVYTIPISAKPQDFLVRITNDSPLPSALVSGEWDAGYSRSRKTR